MCAVRCAVGYAVRCAINAQHTAQPYDKLCIYCITLHTTRRPEKLRASPKFGFHQAFRSGHSTPFTRTRGMRRVRCSDRSGHDAPQTPEKFPTSGVYKLLHARTRIHANAHTHTKSKSTHEIAGAFAVPVVSGFTPLPFRS